MNRPDLMALVGEHVKVTNSLAGSSWTGKLVALADDPSLILDQADGTRMTLPQRFTVTRLDEPQPEPACPVDLDPAVTEIERLSTELYKAQDAIAFVHECCDIADRYSTPVTTLLVREWLEGAKCGRQLLADRQTQTAERSAQGEASS